MQTHRSIVAPILRVGLAAFLALLAGQSRADFPTQPSWTAINSAGNCIYENAPNYVCVVRYSKQEIFNAIDSQVNARCGWITDWTYYHGTSPREIWIRYYQADCSNPNAIDFFGAEENGPASLQCPKNSDLVSGGQCRCRPGLTQVNNSLLTQVDNTCSGGKNNSCGPNGCPPPVGNPVNPANGNKFERQTVYRGLNGFELSLVFNSFDDLAPRFGRDWRDSFDRQVLVDGSNAVVYRPDGKALVFVPSAGAWATDADTLDALTELKDGSGTRTGWQLYVPEGDETETYDVAGKLLSIRSRSGLVQTLVYSDGTGGPNGGFVLDANGNPTGTLMPAGFLIRVSDNFGRVLVFGYNGMPEVVKVTDPAGGVYRFAYSGTSVQLLTSITFPDGKMRSFVYNEPANTGGANLPTALTGIVDENSARYATFQYDSLGRAVSTQHAGGAELYTLSYGTGGSTTVTDPLGTARNYGFQTIFGAFKNTGISGPACPSCGPAAQTFDANGNVASKTDWNGNVTNYAYDLARDLETSRTEAFGTPQQRTISTQWHGTWRLPAKVAEPLRITSYVYSGDGGASCGFEADGITLVPGVLCSKTIQPTSDATGAQGFGAPAAGTPRTWNYTYNVNGSVLTMDGPRTDAPDVTTYAYYANDDPDLGKRGNVATVTNALGQTTQITAYNGHGQPLTIVDPNGLTTELAYDQRMRLTSRNVGGETTGYTYDGVGQLTQVTLPDLSHLTYTYDAAHRLTGIADNLGNKIAYTLDAMGNRTQEQVFDPSNTLAQTRSRVYDGLNRLFQDIGAQNQTTQYAYDNQGNVTSVTDPLTHVTGNQYDALNRLVQVTDPNLGQTRYGYNGIDQLTSVTDPRTLTTTYNYDGLSNLNSQVSPDTGTTQNTYDSAGNLLTQTDAKGQTTTYVYDALNRVTSITFADGSKQLYTYDQGNNALGRLASIAELDPAQNQTSLLTYSHDQHGRVVTETRTVAGVGYVTAYQYDSAGRLSGMTYPSGRTIAYSFDALGRINQVTTTAPAAGGGQTQVLASNVGYQPFGGVNGYLLGNGQSYARGFDTDGRIASYSLGATTYALGYDAASRILFINDTGNPQNSNTYGYDNLDRLTSAVLPNVPFAYGYDAVGNRLSKTVGAATDSYSYSATSNQLTGIVAGSGPNRSFTFDPNGSTVNDGVNQYVYDARGRMVQSVGALGATAYQVNALGQRIRKTNSSDDRVFVYDTRGRLITESTPAGSLLREYLYLNDIPLAVIQ